MSTSSCASSDVSGQSVVKAAEHQSPFTIAQIHDELGASISIQAVARFRKDLQAPGASALRAIVPLLRHDGLFFRMRDHSAASSLSEFVLEVNYGQVNAESDKREGSCVYCYKHALGLPLDSSDLDFVALLEGDVPGGAFSSIVKPFCEGHVQSEYHLLGHNCQKFSEDLLNRLAEEPTLEVKPYTQYAKPLLFRFGRQAWNLIRGGIISQNDYLGPWRTLNPEAVSYTKATWLCKETHSESMGTLRWLVRQTYENDIIRAAQVLIDLSIMSGFDIKFGAQRKPPADFTGSDDDWDGSDDDWDD